MMYATECINISSEDEKKKAIPLGETKLLNNV